MSKQQIRELAEGIAADMFVNGVGETAERLVLWRDSDQRDLGGLCLAAVVERINAAIVKAIPDRCWRCGAPPTEDQARAGA